jgi:hypothetical protein
MAEADENADTEQWSPGHEAQELAGRLEHRCLQGRIVQHPTCTEGVHYFGFVQEGDREGGSRDTTRNHQGHDTEDKQTITCCVEADGVDKMS